jgi:hypothetical protein
MISLTKLIEIYEFNFEFIFFTNIQIIISLAEQYLYQLTQRKQALKNN